MARKSPTISQEELYPPDEEFAREDAPDARLLDLDVEEESPFLRAQKRVSARRGPIPKQAALGLKWSLLALVVIVLGSVTVGAVYHYGEHSWRFRVESSDNIEIAGARNVTHAQIMEVMGGDIGRNIFFIPLAQRKAQLEQIPWVESASIMRFVPNRLKVEIHERTPVAFARVGPRIWLVDSVGTLMELPATAKKKFSFPVILGMSSGESASTRLARMKIYNELVHELDAGSARYSQDLSEVDLSDPEDVKVSVANPEVLVHLGSSNYLERYRIFIAHLREWTQQFDKLQSVDLRYERQIVVNPDLHGLSKQPPLAAKAAKAAISAGVKPAALVSHETQKPAVPPPTTKLLAHTTVRPAARNGRRSRWAKHAKVVARNSQAPKPGPAPIIVHSDLPMSSKPSPARSAATATTSATAAPAKSASNSVSSTAGPAPAKPAIDVNAKKPNPGIPKDKDQDHP
ncbi:MAG TPA: FtsQ-type POTRA domain-containing protein [Terriglobales bacterium]|nr:FtsQ-type POTRA domain-containing protein [Terriglobales bacterium]